MDTDTCVWALRGDARVLTRLRSSSPSAIFVTTMTLAELHFGVLGSRDPDANRARVSTFLGPLTVLHFDADAALAHAEIRWALRQSPIGERDLVIAAVARVHGLTLVTGNAREFVRVPDLPVEDWAT
ncbi:MAG: type II toxin-antitoxin system VapC family toxin [Longimicrobiales bacterium]|nr:type II toxin-antitoxin system VapC family toxin [Longimicrobiales bacterium]